MVVFRRELSIDIHVEPQGNIHVRIAESGCLVVRLTFFYIYIPGGRIEKTFGLGKETVKRLYSYQDIVDVTESMKRFQKEQNECDLENQRIICDMLKENPDLIKYVCVKYPNPFTVSITIKAPDAKIEKYFINRMACLYRYYGGICVNNPQSL